MVTLFRRRWPALAAILAALAVAPSASGQESGHAAIFRDGKAADCGACHGRAERNTFVFDRTRSRITFKIGNYGFANAQGAFADFAGGFRFDPENVDKGSVFATIRADSIDMGEALLSAVVRERFLDAERFPMLSFAGSAIGRTGKKAGTVTGTLTIRGIAREVTLEVRFNKAGRHPETGEELAGFSATASFRRSDFGIALGLPAVGDEIRVDMEIVGKRLR